MSQLEKDNAVSGATAPKLVLNPLDGQSPATPPKVDGADPPAPSDARVDAPASASTTPSDVDPAPGGASAITPTKDFWATYAPNTTAQPKLRVLTAIKANRDAVVGHVEALLENTLLTTDRCSAEDIIALRGYFNAWVNARPRILQYCTVLSRIDAVDKLMDAECHYQREMDGTSGVESATRNDLIACLAYLFTDGTLLRVLVEKGVHDTSNIAPWRLALPKDDALYNIVSDPKLSVDHLRPPSEHDQYIKIHKKSTSMIYNNRNHIGMFWHVYISRYREYPDSDSQCDMVKTWFAIRYNTLTSKLRRAASSAPPADPPADPPALVPSQPKSDAAVLGAKLHITRAEPTPASVLPSQQADQKPKTDSAAPSAPPRPKATLPPLPPSPPPAVADIGALEAEIAKLKCKNITLTSANIKLRAKEDTLENHAAAREKKIHDLERALVEAEEALCKERHDLAVLSEQMTTLQEQYAALSCTAAVAPTAEPSSPSLVDRLSSLTKENTQLSKQLKSARSSLEFYAKESESMRKKLGLAGAESGYSQGLPTATYKGAVGWSDVESGGVSPATGGSSAGTSRSSSPALESDLSSDREEELAASTRVTPARGAQPTRDGDLFYADPLVVDRVFEETHTLLGDLTASTRVTPARVTPARGAPSSGCSFRVHVPAVKTAVRMAGVSSGGSAASRESPSAELTLSAKLVNELSPLIDKRGEASKGDWQYIFSRIITSCERMPCSIKGLSPAKRKMYSDLVRKYFPGFPDLGKLYCL
ncbi:MAG: hypothetical protein M0R66_04385 [Candidatus Omnitrophica bacterium]|nr:hypothetical protein [Candidatus Omnitrophota bacterium]